VNDLMPFIQAQRRGFNAFRKNEDPKPRDMILRIQKGALDHIMHPAVTKRLSDTSIYGNTYQLHDHLSKSSMHYQVTKIAKMLKFSSTAGATKAHQQYIVDQIEKALK
jgi:hypothetical protein